MNWRKPLTSQAIGMPRNQLYAGIVDVPESDARNNAATSNR